MLRGVFLGYAKRLGWEGELLHWRAQEGGHWLAEGAAALEVVNETELGEGRAQEEEGVAVRLVDGCDARVVRSIEEGVVDEGTKRCIFVAHAEDL